MSHNHSIIQKVIKITIARVSNPNTTPENFDNEAIEKFMQTVYEKIIELEKKS